MATDHLDNLHDAIDEALTRCWDAEKLWHDVIVAADSPTQKADLARLAIHLWYLHNTVESLANSVAARLNKFLDRDIYVTEDGWEFSKGYPSSRTEWDAAAVLRTLAEDFAALLDEGVAPAQAVADTYLAVMPATKSTGFKRTGLKQLGHVPDFYFEENVVDPIGRARMRTPKPRPLDDQKEHDV